jgi:hypothetical protein
MRLRIDPVEEVRPAPPGRECLTTYTGHQGLLVRAKRTCRCVPGTSASDPRRTWQPRMSLFFPIKRYSFPALVLGEGGNGHEVFCDCDILEFYGSHYRRLGGSDEWQRQLFGRGVHKGNMSSRDLFQSRRAVGLRRKVLFSSELSKVSGDERPPTEAASFILSANGVCPSAESLLLNRKRTLQPAQ